jgi:hypothetical protein
MRIGLRLACMGWMVCVAGAASPREPSQPPPLIDPNDDRLVWYTHRGHGETCVLTGTAVSEMRDDAFEVQFRQSLRQKLQLFVLIPRLPKGGTVYMEAPTTRDRWNVYTENFKPALLGEQAEALRRNVATGIPLVFTFNFGKGKPVIYQTVPRGSISAALQFVACLREVEQEAAMKAAAG